MSFVCGLVTKKITRPGLKEFFVSCWVMALLSIISQHQHTTAILIETLKLLMSFADAEDEFETMA